MKGRKDLPYNFGKYIKFLKLSAKYGERVASGMVEALHPLIPDIYYRFGEDKWIEIIVLKSKTFGKDRKVENTSKKKKVILSNLRPYLEGVLQRHFPDTINNLIFIDTEIYLTREEIEKAKKLIENALKGEYNEK